MEIGHVWLVCLFPLKFLLDKVAVWSDVRNPVSHYGGVLLPVIMYVAGSSGHDYVLLPPAGRMTPK